MNLRDNAPQPHSQPGRLARRFAVATAAYAHRRRIATGFAVVIAALVGYHALFGANGVIAYRAKRSENRMLALKLEKIEAENSRLKQHVEHLKTDPDAIEYEAHTRLRYARPDQVIVLNNTPDPAMHTPDPASHTPGPAAAHTSTAATPDAHSALPAADVSSH